MLEGYQDHFYIGIILKGIKSMVVYCWKDKYLIFKIPWNFPLLWILWRNIRWGNVCINWVMLGIRELFMNVFNICYMVVST